MGRYRLYDFRLDKGEVCADVEHDGLRYSVVLSPAIVEAISLGRDLAGVVEFSFCKEGVTVRTLFFREEAESLKETLKRLHPEIYCNLLPFSETIDLKRKPKS